MSASVFDPSFDQLPQALPVFPLPGVLLLPRGRLPLNIFEPRYLAMTRDALAGDRLIGMVQPKPGADGHRRGDIGAAAIYPVGCAGRLTAFAETDDGRYLITLTGLCRFQVKEELPERHGYRCVQVDWSGYEGDLEASECCGLKRENFESALAHYFRIYGIQADWTTIKEAPDERLIAPQDDGSYLIDGMASIYDVRTRLGVDYTPDGRFATIAGLVLHELGRFPQQGDSMPWCGYALHVEKMDGRRIDKIRVVKIADAPEGDAGGA